MFLHCLRRYVSNFLPIKLGSYRFNPQDTRKSGQIRQIMDKVSVTMRGLATLVSVNCGDKAAKMCKKLKVNPKPYVVNHYSNGELNKEYDRKTTESSMVCARFFVSSPFVSVSHTFLYHSGAVFA